MLSRIPAAVARGILVVLLIIFPGVALPSGSTDMRMISLFVAICAGIFITAEYLAKAPSLLEFRSARPLNRIRFVGAMISVFLVTSMLRDPVLSSPASRSADAIGTMLARLTDLPFSPVRMMRQLMVPLAPTPLVEAVTKASAISFSVAAIVVLLFAVVVVTGNWPSNRRFNIWVNLPTFDPVGKGDPVIRLRRLGLFNVLLGCLVPFLVPTFMAYTSGFVDPMALAAPHTLIWTVTGWAFLPASLMMRGIALIYVARLMARQRRQDAAGGLSARASLS